MMNSTLGFAPGGAPDAVTDKRTAKAAGYFKFIGQSITVYDLRTSKIIFFVVFLPRNGIGLG
jgi:hypothetical protein